MKRIILSLFVLLVACTTEETLVPKDSQGNQLGGGVITPQTACMFTKAWYITYPQLEYSPTAAKRDFLTMQIKCNDMDYGNTATVLTFSVSVPPQSTGPYIIPVEFRPGSGGSWIRVNPGETKYFTKTIAQYCGPVATQTQSVYTRRISCGTSGNAFETYAVVINLVAATNNHTINATLSAQPSFNAYMQMSLNQCSTIYPSEP